ncbi:MAG: dihydrofolate reductase [Cyclobacteriaceae bacterium]|nr:dihydrofolate reductase [Cyclobacteriaceae bacterium]MCH8514845.1 dihydrofolate reductase [Cyclobacteriaceae bacterium]
MEIAMIAAIGKNFAIGANGEIPWHLPKDLQFFKRTTMSYPLIMGRKTYESIGKPLPGRVTAVITSDISYDNKTGILAFTSIREAIDYLEKAGSEKVFLSGGEGIYKEGLIIADNLYITRVDLSPDNADAFFPKWDEKQWELENEELSLPDEKNPYTMYFQKWNRRF